MLATGGLGLRRLHDVTNTVDEAVVATNINGVVLKGTEGRLADNGVIDEILAEATSVGEGGARERRERRRTEGVGGDTALHDAVLADGRVDGSGHGLVGLNGGVRRGKDGKGAGSLEGGADTAGLQASKKEIKVVRSLKVTLLFANVDTFGTPDLSGSLEGAKRVQDGSIQGKGGASDRRGGEGSTGRGGDGENGGGELHCCCCCCVVVVVGIVVE
jgi:hypothetical protein